MRHRKRGQSHTTLTDTATEVVGELRRLSGIKMIAPGIIDGKGSSNKRHITAVFTTAGIELIISGQGVQKVEVHTAIDPHEVFSDLKRSKRLSHFTFRTRERKPGQ